MLLSNAWLSGFAPASNTSRTFKRFEDRNTDPEPADAGLDGFDFSFGTTEDTGAEAAEVETLAPTARTLRPATDADAPSVELNLSFDKFKLPEFPDLPDMDGFLAAARGGGGGGGRFFWRGPREITIEHDGITRKFIVDVPASFNPNDADKVYSAVMVFHGGLGDGRSMLSTRFSQAGDAEDFIVIYPSAVEGLWNDGRDTTETGYDDLGFVQAVLDEVTTNWKVDADSVFAAGASSGGMFVQRLATEMPDAFQGYGVVAANLPEPLGGQATAGGDEPIVFFQGTEDPYMPFEGGELPGRNVAVGAGGDVLSAQGTADYWAEQNNTAMGDYVQMPDIADDGMTTTMRVSEDGSVVQYVIDGGTHTWPGVDAWWSTSGPSTQDINATDIMVDFFSDYGL